MQRRTKTTTSPREIPASRLPASRLPGSRPPANHPYPEFKPPHSHIPPRPNVPADPFVRRRANETTISIHIVTLSKSLADCRQRVHGRSQPAENTSEVLGQVGEAVEASGLGDAATASGE